jgi:hypothetical protein
MKQKYFCFKRFALAVRDETDLCITSLNKRWRTSFGQLL